MMRSGGRIELICGCMFSGKTTELIRRLRRARTEGREVKVFKHQVDSRAGQHHIATHDGQRWPAEQLTRAGLLPARCDPAEVIAIDDAHFFDVELVEACRLLAGAGRRVIVTALDRDAWGQPFELTRSLASVADELLQLRAVCAVCGQPAEFTQRIAPFDGSMVGGSDKYQARCAACFVPPEPAGRPNASQPH